MTELLKPVITDFAVSERDDVMQRLPEVKLEPTRKVFSPPKGEIPKVGHTGLTKAYPLSLE